MITGAGLCVAAGAVLAGGLATAATQTGGTVDHWGHGTVSPVSVSLPGTVAEVGSNNGAEYALLTNGTVYAWGYGIHGELGNGSTKNSTTPVQVQFPAGVTIASIPTDASPWDSAYAIDTTGHVWAWGANGGGEFCLNNLQSYLTPVELPFTNVTAVAGAAQHETYDAGGVLYSCGVNNNGQLGDGSTTNSHKPVKVSGLSGASVTALVSGFADTGALLSNGQFWDWGWNANGQLGDGTAGASSDVPVQTILPSGASQVVLGGNGPKDGAGLALLSDGSVYAWGANASGQLGTGNLKSEPTPVKISPPSGVSYEVVAAGGDTCYAVSTTGDVYAWGSNSAGQIGNGTKTSSKTPVKVLSGATALLSATSTDVAVALQG